MEISLDRLKPGERGWVSELRLPPERAVGLLRLGLLPGTELRCLRRCPLGDPAVYRFRGTDLALRKKDAARIAVRREEAL